MSALRKPAPIVAGASLELDDWFGMIGSGSGQFFLPAGVAADPKDGTDTIYVADTGNQRIQYLNHSGDYLKQIGRFGIGIGEFNKPYVGCVWKAGPVSVRV
ncbi:MAG: hypothetical protein MUP44_00200 [Anaerolineales bacterium]|nr:hypothetical protein [Anaerolineales bacterium]